VQTDTANVLVVDDQESGRFVKVQILRRAGFKVHEAATGQEALELARRHPMDLILLDVNLPDISGLEVGQILRKEYPGPPALQILHVSNTAVTDSDRARGLNAGADAYLPEPMEASVLLATAHALLRVRRAETSLAEALAGEQRARGEAEQANRLKDEFIATLSHELRTPLNALMGWIWQLRHATLDESGRERALDSLERNTRVQAQLINDLLDVSRITKGKLQLQIRVVDLGAVASHTLESVKTAAARKHIALKVNVEPVRVAGDAGRLQQVIGNLLNNAIQFTPSRGRISLSVGREAGEAVLSVADSGAGIEKELLPYVFEPFRQGKGGLTRAHGGLGLGLAVVQQLIELHDGRVSVSSDGPGRGSTFTVRLPETSKPAAPSSEAPLILSGLEVLVLGETPEGREMLAAILESSGAHVVQKAASGDLAAARANTALDAIVHDRGRDVALIVVDSGSKSSRQRTATGDVHLSKPIRAGALVRSLATLEFRDR
jgi:signal transduction histidine kinase